MGVGDVGDVGEGPAHPANPRKLACARFRASRLTGAPPGFTPAPCCFGPPPPRVADCPRNFSRLTDAAIYLGRFCPVPGAGGRVREQHLLPTCWLFPVPGFRFLFHNQVWFKMERKIEIEIRTETVSDSPSAPSPGLVSVICLVVAILNLIAEILLLIAAL